MVELTETEIILYVGGALVTVVGILWKMFLQSVKEKEKRLQDCESKHEKHHDTIVNLTEQMSYLRGQMEGVKGLARSVLDKLDGVKNDDK